MNPRFFKPPGILRLPNNSRRLPPTASRPPSSSSSSAAPLSTTLPRTMRLPYAPTTPPPPAAGEPSDPSDPTSTAAIYARIAARRAPRPLIPLDLALLHSPPIADGWNTFLGAIRTSTLLSPAILELAISRVGALTGAAWEWRAHAALAAKAGVSRAVLQWVLEAGCGEEAPEELVGMGGRERAVVRYVDAMTRDVRVGEGVFAGLREWFGEREVVELTAGVAAYNCVSRFLVALDVGEMNDEEMVVPPEAK